MGSGKTTVSKALYETLPEFKYVDIDTEIEKSTQKKISEIFLKHGEPFFRMLESEKIKHFCTNGERQIISTGGGIFENEENRRVMLDNGQVIYLKTSPEEIYNRIKLETHRPLLKRNFSVEKIASIMKDREKNYEKADITVDTTGKMPSEVVESILGEIYEYD